MRHILTTIGGLVLIVAIVAVGAYVVHQPFRQWADARSRDIAGGEMVPAPERSLGIKEAAPTILGAPVVDSKEYTEALEGLLRKELEARDARIRALEERLGASSTTVEQKLDPAPVQELEKKLNREREASPTASLTIDGKVFKVWGVASNYHLTKKNLFPNPTERCPTFLVQAHIVTDPTILARYKDPNDSVLYNFRCLDRPPA